MFKIIYDHYVNSHHNHLAFKKDLKDAGFSDNWYKVKDELEMAYLGIEKYLDCYSPDLYFFEKKVLALEMLEMVVDIYEGNDNEEGIETVNS